MMVKRFLVSFVPSICIPPQSGAFLYFASFHRVRFSVKFSFVFSFLFSTLCCRDSQFFHCMCTYMCVFFFPHFCLCLASCLNIATFVFICVFAYHVFKMFESSSSSSLLLFSCIFYLFSFVFVHVVCSLFFKKKCFLDFVYLRRCLCVQTCLCFHHHRHHLCFPFVYVSRATLSLPPCSDGVYFVSFSLVPC